MNSKVDKFLAKQGPWRAVQERLREILLTFPLEEELKWGEPCYTLGGKNIVLIGAFKEYCSLLFFKGALLEDPEGVLKAPGQLQAGRQMRFANAAEIAAQEGTIRRFVAEAMEVEKSGRKVEMKKHEEYVVPEELARRLEADGELKRAFEALTPGRQRGYFFHIAGAKQAKTREARVEGCVERILAGKGLLD
jgi:uncharacterized protein YdeI (YjbR/CyaY-like superfamily)